MLNKYVCFLFVIYKFAYMCKFGHVKQLTIDFEDDSLNHRVSLFKNVHIFQNCLKHIYWAKVLTDHPKTAITLFVAEYFGMTFGTLNDNTR